VVGLKLSRRQLAASFAAPAVLRAQSQRRMNIVLAIADDLGRNTGAYGDAVAMTPNLDRLAAEGVRFTHGFCTTASCSASRSVMLTGLHNHANGQFGHAHDYHHFSLHSTIRPVPALLKQAGYKTGLVGKFHVAPPAQFAWDLLSEKQERDVYEMAQTAKGFIESCGNSPFYMHVGYGDPHRAAVGFGNDRVYRNVDSKPFDPAKVRVPSWLPDNTGTRRELAEYYQAANRLDYGIGFLLDALKATGQLDNTLFVFLSDNGPAFPNAKTNVYDAGSHLPMIVRAPALAKAGSINNAMISWTDLAPTFLEAAGAASPGYPLHGRSFLPILDRETPPGWDQIFYSHTFHEVTMHYPIRGTRTRRWKYLRNLDWQKEFPHASDLYDSATWQGMMKQGDGAKLGKRPVKDYLFRAHEELYDLNQDPDEVENLAADPRHKDTLLQLRRDVIQFRKRTGDPWLINDQHRAEFRAG
jgi:N-sulfoglucosamine sulfohydrolase